MKKTLSLFVVFLLFVSMLSASAYAEGPSEIKVSSVESAVCGQEVTVEVEICNNPGVAMISLDILYDSEVLEPVSFTGDGLNGWIIYTSAIWCEPTNTFYNGRILNLTFRVKDDAKPGLSAVTVEELIANFDEEQIDFAVSPGGVTVVEQQTAAPTPVAGSGENGNAGSLTTPDGEKEIPTALPQPEARHDQINDSAKEVVGSSERSSLENIDAPVPDKGDTESTKEVQTVQHNHRPFLCITVVCILTAFVLFVIFGIKKKQKK